MVLGSLAGADDPGRIAANRRMILQHLGQVSDRSVVVTFRYRTADAQNNPTGYRTARMLIHIDRHFADSLEREAYLNQVIRDAFFSNYEQFWNDQFISGAYNITGNFYLDAHGNPEFDMRMVQEIINEVLLREELGLGMGDLYHMPSGAAHDHTLHSTRMYDTEGFNQHRSFKYMIQGCDLGHLDPLTDQDGLIHTDECGRMCAYRMLTDRNTPGPNNGPTPRVFQPATVNRWLNDHGQYVGDLTDGLSPEQIQEHAIAHRYPHCAMDISRSVLNFHYPLQRHKHYKTIIYVVAGDHCQPITDPDVVNSIMRMVPEKLGIRTHTQNVPLLGLGSDNAKEGVHASASVKRGRRRERSLDITRADFATDPLRIVAPDEQCLDHAVEDDLVHDRILPEVEGGATKAAEREPVFPLIDQTDRFHCHPKADMMVLVEERCRPDYFEPGPPNHVHFYITTDEDNVTYIYHYLIRVRRIDPLRYATSYNGECRLVRMNNVHWVASACFPQIAILHRSLQPLEPFRSLTLATYGFHLWCSKLRALRRADTGSSSMQIWEGMSHYSPNLQRLADAQSGYLRPPLLRLTLNPPYTNPRDPSTSSETPRTLIPLSLRRRIDFIRSYTAILWNLPDSPDTIPIHSLTDPVEPFDPRRLDHQALPPGHYLIRIPTTAEVRAAPPEAPLGTEYDWHLWSRSFPPGQQRLVTHRMVRALLDRGLIQTHCIVTICPSDSRRQRDYGMALIAGMREVIRALYTHPDLDMGAVKHIVNHIVGACNGTTLPRAGKRYVFANLVQLWQLIIGSISVDQMLRMRILHNTGTDPDWHQPYDYYELDTSGIAYKPIHFQPLYTVVLEQQALNLFDIARTIPRDHLIQIHVDALEYFIDDPRVLPQWARVIQDHTVDAEAYANLSGPDILNGGLLGRYKAERPREADQAMYYWEHTLDHSKLPRAVEKSIVDFCNAPLQDPEDRTVVPDWKAAMRHVDPPLGGSDASINEMLDRWMGPADVPFPGEDWSGLLITGTAGTGKTRCIRAIVDRARQQGLRVVCAAYTHAACVQMGPGAVTLSSLFGLQTDAYVRNYICTSPKFKRLVASLHMDYLIIDEISLIPYAILEILYLFHRQHSQTRIVLVGDFNQLPPIESFRSTAGPLVDDSHDYFTHADIFPYLCYDRRRNIPGFWLRLHECHRTDDPILRTIAENPRSVTALQPQAFPLLPSGTEIWRFLAMDNRMRKACNFYCMVRFLQKHPLHPRAHLCLRDLYAASKQQYAARQNNQHTTEESTAPLPTKDWAQLFDVPDALAKGEYRPNHWRYLQDFTYVAGMPVACRCTMRAYTINTEDENGSRKTRKVPAEHLECVNNRRAHIVDIDAESVTLRWDDVAQTAEAEGLPVDTQDCRLNHHDFAFHFVPAFCTTIHWCQGETIREHYAVMDWPAVTQSTKAAYVAVTRGSSAYLHLMANFYTDPWNVVSTTDLTVNILRELYIQYCCHTVRSCRILVEDVVRLLESQKFLCDHCHKDLKTTKYLDSDPARFRVLFKIPEPLGISDAAVICHGCMAYNRELLREKREKSRQNSTIAAL